MPQVGGRDDVKLIKAAKSDQEITGPVESGQHPEEAVFGAQTGITPCTRTNAELPTGKLMEVVCERDNLKLAYERVMRNKGAAGVDNIPVDGLKAHLQRAWPSIKARLLAGDYIPLPVRRVQIPKPDGGVRTLGIPTVVDRLIQQAIHQVLSPLFEPTFHASSYGYRAGKSAHQAIKAARRHVSADYRHVVDIDLKRCFDQLHHDRLMSKLAARIEDKRVLKLIRHYLQSGVMMGGMVSVRHQGAPQGGPLSPLLSNIVLDELDWELDCRGHVFCRYADDCNIYVCSQRAGERVMASISRFIAERLKLEVNESKSAVCRPWKRVFLGYSLTWHKQSRLRIPIDSRKRLESKIRGLFKGAGGRSMYGLIEQLNRLLRGWMAYFRLTETKRILEELDGWLRHKLRCVRWRQWKRPYTRARNLMKLGLDEERAFRSAFNQRGPWFNSGASYMNQALPKRWFDHRGLVSLVDMNRHLQGIQ